MSLRIIPRISKTLNHLTTNPPGDTIIEVMLCIAIAGLVVTGSYALSSHSLQEGISATERTEANKLAEGQIEALKLREKNSAVTWIPTPTYPNANYPGNGFNNIPATASFCLETDAASLTEFTGGTITVNPHWLAIPNPGGLASINGQTDQISTSYYASGANQCVVNNKYYISMSVQSNGTNGQVYWVTVRWQALGGGTLNLSQLYYRLPPYSPPSSPSP